LTNCQANQYLEYEENPVRFRIRYSNNNQVFWTDYYESNEQFGCGFLMKLPIQFSQETINCYFFCGIENKGTRAITNYLCQNWKNIQQKQDYEQEMPVNDSPFIMVFRVNKSNLSQIYCEKVVKLDF
jgi:hypothetical protein